MKKKVTKLTLRRETVRNLEWVAAGAGRIGRIEDNPSIQSGETYCWCTDTCCGRCDPSTEETVLFAV